MRHPLVVAIGVLIAVAVAVGCTSSYSRVTVGPDDVRSRIIEVRLDDGVRCYVYDRGGGGFACVVVR